MGMKMVVAGVLLLGAAAIGGVAATGSRPAAAQEVTVWASPSCGCCGKWVEHMRAEGFQVTVNSVDDLEPMKRANGVPAPLGSCHTAVVDGYVLEGHVPAADARRLLAERPAARGLSVPGMPQSAPGMDIPGEPYSVILFGDGMAPTVFSHHPG